MAAANSASTKEGKHYCLYTVPLSGTAVAIQAKELSIINVHFQNSPYLYPCTFKIVVASEPWLKQATAETPHTAVYFLHVPTKTVVRMYQDGQRIAEVPKALQLPIQVDAMMKHGIEYNELLFCLDADGTK